MTAQRAHKRWPPVVPLTSKTIRYNCQTFLDCLRSRMLVDGLSGPVSQPHTPLPQGTVTSTETWFLAVRAMGDGIEQVPV